MNIHGNLVVLRAVEKSDCEFVRALFNDPEIEKLVAGWAFPLSAYEQELWFENHCTDQNNYRFIVDIPGNGAVGIVTLTDIDWKNRRAMYGIKLMQKNCSKGIGTDAVMAIMRYSFDELGFHRLDGCWFEDNIASIKLHTKLGWTAEGLRREYIYKNGTYKSLVMVGILASDYYRIVQEKQYWKK